MTSQQNRPPKDDCAEGTEDYEDQDDTDGEEHSWLHAVERVSMNPKRGQTGTIGKGALIQILSTSCG